MMCPLSYVEIEHTEAVVISSTAAVERDEAVVFAAVPAEGDDAGCRHLWMKPTMPDVG